MPVPPGVSSGIHHPIFWSFQQTCALPCLRKVAWKQVLAVCSMVVPGSQLKMQLLVMHFHFNGSVAVMLLSARFPHQAPIRRVHHCLH
mmetsp:Transcript_13298/g.36649  ORF Transcript_13298/g.36649 Transcript_13298/m.36649 type:complete len:88 (-) Transcript_13298:458-721(-)